MKETPWSQRTKIVVLIVILIGAVWLIATLTPLMNALLIAAFFAYLLNPLVNLLNRYTKVSHPWGARLIFTLFFLVLASIPTLLGTLVFGQFQRIKSELIAAAIAYEQWIAQPFDFLGYHIYPQLVVDYLEQAGGNVLAAIPADSFSILTGLTTNILWGVVVFISIYFLLKDGSKIKLWLIRIAPVEYKFDIERILNELNEVWGVFLRVQILIFIVLAILMSSGTFLVILLFRMRLLPFSPLGFVLLLILVYTASQQVDNLWLRPQLMGKHLQLHPGLVFAGLTAALLLGGILGAILIVPIMASARVTGRYIYCQLTDQTPWAHAYTEPNNLIYNGEGKHKSLDEGETINPELATERRNGK
ncbi:AI-2E family transporter [Chloroflexota bacterium]